MNSCNNPCGRDGGQRDMGRQAPGNCGANRPMPPVNCGQRQVGNEMRNDGRSRERERCLEDFPLAMAYVPWQRWRDVLQPDEGLCCGTIFKELNLPFTGRKVCK